MKLVLFFAFLSVALWAESSPLFGRVINISENDTLNVRSQPDYKSTKVAELPPNAYMGIEKCTKIKKTSWCRVYPMVQQWYENFGSDSHVGWVNARYLEFKDRGYVMVKGKKNCDYALGCHDGKCEVVYDYGVVNEDNDLEFKIQWIERRYLKGESNFGVTPDNVDGFCNMGMFIEEYLEKNPNYVNSRRKKESK